LDGGWSHMMCPVYEHRRKLVPELVLELWPANIPGNHAVHLTLRLPRNLYET
jgi:hypothetical protein